MEVNSTWEGLVVGALHRFAELMHSILADNCTGLIFHEVGYCDLCDESKEVDKCHRAMPLATTMCGGEG